MEIALEYLWVREHEHGMDRECGRGAYASERQKSTDPDRLQRCSGLRRMRSAGSRVVRG